MISSHSDSVHVEEPFASIVLVSSASLTHPDPMIKLEHVVFFHLKIPKLLLFYSDPESVLFVEGSGISLSAVAAELAVLSFQCL